MSKKQNIILVDRTVFNLRVSILSNDVNINSDSYLMTVKVLNRIIEDEKKCNRPIMDIPMELSEAKAIFSNDKQHERITFLVQ